MQLFNLINGWAGRNDLIDTVLRLFYVSAVPILATALAGVLILAPRPATAPSRWRIAWATLISVVFSLATMAAVNSFASNLLHTGALSPRPFVTHWVNALLVEPNDNSFPCPEVMLATCMTVMLWMLAPLAGRIALGALLLFGFSRVFCGMNYPIDIAASYALGAAWSALALAVCRVTFALPSRAGQPVTLRPGYQAACSAMAVFLVALITLIAISRVPRFSGKVFAFLSPKQATAAPAKPAQKTKTVQPVAFSGSLPKAVPPTMEGAMHEGEAISTAPKEPIPTHRRPQDGRIAEAEIYLTNSLQAFGLPHSIYSVEVAEINPDNKIYRCAAVRFEVKAAGAEERKRVADTAATIVKRAFQVDSQLQNVDVLGVVLNSLSAKTKHLVFAPGAVPVFTASVERSKLKVQGAHAWTNGPNIDGGSWLKARSLLYINEQVLPPGTAPSATPAPIVTPKPVAPAKMRPSTSKTSTQPSPAPAKPTAAVIKTQQQRQVKPTARPTSPSVRVQVSQNNTEKPAPLQPEPVVETAKEATEPSTPAMAEPKTASEAAAADTT